MIDVMVGLAVGLVALVLVYQAFAAIDTVRRNAAAVSDAQGGAAFALYALQAQVGNAGAGIAAFAPWLATCPAGADAATTLRPISVLIRDGGGPDRPDSLVVRQALAPATGAPAAFAEPAAANASFRVESPDGFALGDRVVAISRDGACATTVVTAVGSSAAGVVELAHAPIPTVFPRATVLLNLGPSGRASTARFDVVTGSLRSTDIGNGDAPVPLVANVVNLKFQYGIDGDGDGMLDTWTAASGDWAPEALLAAPPETLGRIKAIRIGLIVRTEPRERTLLRDFRWVLFDCALDDKSACPGRLEGTIAASPGGGYRYRAYETVVALPNVIWSRGP